MKDTNLGGFEELVLLTVATLNENAYSISIKSMLMEQTGRSPSVGALHSALTRLEEKGYLDSNEGGASKERGGRRKRFYRINKLGVQVLNNAMSLRNQFYKQIPDLKMER